jgi:NAD(P)-dependent dehydrogenase (short-subunit alcohol dehydrogenase family)
MLLEDHSAVVTGGASGIGRATALALADHGSDVVVADRRTDPREGGVPTVELVEEETDARAIHVECDISDPSTIESAFNAAADFGGLDLLVNNAGVFHRGDPLEISPEQYSDLMNVNARGTFFTTQFAGRHLVEQGGGAIVNVASTSAFRADGTIAAYSASKAAIIQTTRTFADALGPLDVRVNAVSPGSIDTELSRARSEQERQDLLESIPSRRIGDPADVARVIVFLASDLARYVNGENVVVDGGLSI